MFTNASRVQINGGRFTNATTYNYATGQTGIDILLEASAPEAAHDSSARDPPPRCFPGTREEFVEDIIQWAVPPVGNAPPPIYWMKGPAGVGKSAVAQTCVEKLTRQGKNCLSFFFSIIGRNKHQKFFPSLAYQLATINSDYHDLIDRKVRRNKTLVDKTMEAQFLELIIDPLRELDESGKRIGERIHVFVDGLDECESKDSQCEIIEIVTAVARAGTTPLRWAFFSRPEPHIEATFSKANIYSLCYATILPISCDADGDIELYLRAGFDNILRCLNISMVSPWPTDHEMRKLVRAANGLFIYAKTVLRFVGQTDSLNPDELLRAILAMISDHSKYGIATDAPFAELDAFYLLIMQRIPPKTLPTIHRVLAVLCRASHSSAVIIANMSGISKTEVEAASKRMSAVVQFEHQCNGLEFGSDTDTNLSFLCTNVRLPKEVPYLIQYSLGGSISFYHKSFKDFLRDPLRSGAYCIKTIATAQHFHKYERILARHFEESHCWQDSELVRAPDAPNSASSLSYPYRNELINSLIEVWLYDRIQGKGRPFGADFDFRKQLSVSTSIDKYIFPDQDKVRVTRDRYINFRKTIRRTQLLWLQPGDFPKFNVASFKKDIEKQQRKNVIRPHSASLSLGSRGRADSGLFVVGNGPKSIFWYWEINYDLETRREFRTSDLVEGERVFREWFDSQMDG